MIPLPKPKMSAVDIVDFVAEYFGSDPSKRSLNPNYHGITDDPTSCRCLYCGPDGRQCAFALFVTDEDRPKLREGKMASNNLRCGRKLRPEVEHLEPFTKFWDRLQDLHDVESYWNTEGFTDRGKQECEMLRGYAASAFCQVDETTNQDVEH